MLAKLFGGRHEFRASYIENKYLKPGPPGTGRPFSSLEDRLSVVLDLHQGVCAETFVDASNLYIHLIDALWAVYPDIRFILGVRHVRDFVLSAMERSWHKRCPEELMVFPGDPAHEAWPWLEPVERMAFLWVHRNGTALRALRKLPAECWTLARIENLESRELERLALHAGVPVKDPEAVHRGVNKGPNLEQAQVRRLTEREEKCLMKIAEPVMVQLGYLEAEA